MEIIVGGEYLDLFKDTVVTIDYDIFPISDISTRTVSYTNEFDIPITNKNKRILDPIENSDNKYSCILQNDDGSISLSGTLYVDSKYINVVGETYTITIIDAVKEGLDKLGDGIENIVSNDTDSFLWDFTDQADIVDGGITILGSAPNDDSGNRFFLSSCNFNGEKYKDFIDGYPVYAAIPEVGIVQLLWSWKYSAFINSCMDYAGIVNFIDINDSDILANTITFGELSVNINAPFISEANRDMQFTIDGIGRVDNITYDSCDQLQNHYAISSLDNSYRNLTGMAETIYDIQIYGSYTIRFTKTVPTLTGYGGEWDSYPDVEVFIILKSPDDYEEYGRISVGTFTFGAWVNEGVFGTGENQYTLYSFEATINQLETSADLIEFELKGTREVNFGYGISFDNAYYTYGIILPFDYPFESTILFDGFYTLSDFSTKAGYAYLTAEMKETSGLNLYFNTKEILHPAIYSGEIDRILPEESLAETKMKISDVLNDILNRYNLGVWEDSSGNIRITNIDDRYSAGSIDLSHKLIDEETEIEFSSDVIKTITYKNKTNKNESTIINVGGSNYTLGDVFEVIVNADGDVDENISLSSFPASREFYGERADSGLSDAFFRANAYGVLYEIEHWGGAYVNRMTISDTGVSHGFRQKKPLDIRQAYVADNTFTNANNDELIMYPMYSFELRGGLHDDGDIAKEYFEVDSFNSDGTKTILIGDEDLKIRDDGTVTIASNFNITGQNLDFNKKYNFKTYLTNSEINAIRDGKKVVVNGIEYKPIKLSGVSFDEEGSVVSISMILN